MKKNYSTITLGLITGSLLLASTASLAETGFCENQPQELCQLAEKSCLNKVKGNPIEGKVTFRGKEVLDNGTAVKYKIEGDGYVNIKTITIKQNNQNYTYYCEKFSTTEAATTPAMLKGGAGYTFALPGNQAYNILPGNLYLPAQNGGYTVTYQKNRGQGLSAPRPGGYAFTLPANQKIVINPGNLQLPGNAEGYSIIYANSQ